MKIAASFISGGLFGLGLVISGMSNPAKVIGFLDIAGNWDPSLAFVMAGGLIVTAIGYRLVFRRTAPVCDSQFHVPTNRVIDARLIGGAAIFGIGWGLGGFCPGPGIVATALGHIEAIAFVAAMLAGMWLKDRLFGTA
ncbi:YeeE/YedE family protein [Gimibacter soli]|uniref:YeeE/YedE family protein n=1 Tax=Gimibacter soli TaxID=3024400 RepID=A0AAE9XV60_9PROT|nr:YeeE/YedE family protein [Gimibacter soli]WCL55340.1 YeeE/YedE family protein [Gimibacter soli]